MITTTDPLQLNITLCYYCYVPPAEKLSANYHESWLSDEVQPFGSTVRSILAGSHDVLQCVRQKSEMMFAWNRKLTWSLADNEVTEYRVCVRACVFLINVPTKHKLTTKSIYIYIYIQVYINRNCASIHMWIYVDIKQFDDYSLSTLLKLEVGLN